jgi:hypothetical protein
MCKQPEPAEAGDSAESRRLSPAPRVEKVFGGHLTWGSTAFHPRLYAVARSAGWNSVYLLTNGLFLIQKRQGLSTHSSA